MRRESGLAIAELPSELPSAVRKQSAAQDDQQGLVERIIGSPSFARSPRLSAFLKHVCKLYREGRLSEINETAIGLAVFERDEQYDPAFDSIVRSHASRLRSRLQEYFEAEGSSERLIVRIPKGTYVPVFEHRELPSVATSHDYTVPTHEAEPVPTSALLDPLRVDDGYLGKVVATVPPDDYAPPKRARSRIYKIIALIAVALITSLSVIRLFEPSDHMATHPLWGQLFQPRQQTVVVVADSGLVMLQGFTKRRVDLDAYVSGEYLKNVSVAGMSDEVLQNLATRRYTSMVDFTAEAKIRDLLNEKNNEVVFRYSRDIRVDDLKGHNLILLGTYESTPWVQLFETSMNFYFVNRLSDGVFSAVNRHPRPGEMSQYDRLEKDSLRTVYGLVALRPNLNRSGKVLILEGQTMAGTQTAMDFVFDDTTLLPFLNRIRKRDEPIPYFELLLRSTSLAGQSSKTEIVAYRVEGD